jgi:hypothetical protein
LNLYGLGRVRHGYAGFAETLIEYDLWSDARIRAADYDRKRAFGLLRPHGEFEATCWGATWVMVAGRR